jgi:hypothetical protein
MHLDIVAKRVDVFGRTQCSGLSTKSFVPERNTAELKLMESIKDGLAPLFKGLIPPNLQKKSPNTDIKMKDHNKGRIGFTPYP